MSGFGHLDLLHRGPVSVVRVLNHRPLFPEEVEGLVAEWNSVANRPDCRTLVVDLSQVTILSSEMLSKLIVLQRRLKQKQGKLVLYGIRPEAREVLSWTKLDRLFEIQEDAEPESVMSDVWTDARCEETLSVCALVHKFMVETDLPRETRHVG